MLLEQKPCLSNLLPQGVAHSTPDKHGFCFCQPIYPGTPFHRTQTPCLESPIPYQGLEVAPGAIIMNCIYFGLGFSPSTVQVAAHPISMVFQIRHPKFPGINTPIRTKPCLSNLLPQWLRQSNSTANLLSMVFDCERILV